MKPYGALHSKRVCRFESRADLVDALLASCHLPLMSDGSLTTRFRGRRVIDGGETGWGRAVTKRHGGSSQAGGMMGERGMQLYTLSISPSSYVPIPPFWPLFYVGFPLLVVRSAS